MVCSDINRNREKTPPRAASHLLTKGGQGGWNMKTVQSGTPGSAPACPLISCVVLCRSPGSHPFSYSKELTATLPQHSCPSEAVMRTRDDASSKEVPMRVSTTGSQIAVSTATESPERKGELRLDLNGSGGLKRQASADA